MSAVLTIVGSSARAAAQSAARSGFRVYAADMFADQDLCRVALATRAAEYPAGLESILAGPQSGVWMYTGALENHPEQIARWQDVRPLAGNPAEVVRRVRNPLLVRDALRDAGLPAPDVRLDAAALPRDGSWLVKPLRSAGGSRIGPLDESWPAPAVLPTDYYFQQRHAGTPVAAIYLAATGGVKLLGVTKQLCGAAWGGASEFQYCGSLGPRKLSAELTAGFSRLGAVLHEAFALIGLFGVDALLQDDNDVWPVEVNPRYTASVEVLERATSLEAVASHLAACQNESLLDPPTAHRTSGKLIVWASRRCRFPSRSGLPGELLGFDSAPSLADIPAPDTVIEAGCPIATVLADADRTEGVAEQLIQRAAMLQACCPEA